jgi:hypothetical protein
VLDDDAGPAPVLAADGSADGQLCGCLCRTKGNKAVSDDRRGGQTCSGDDTRSPRKWGLAVWVLAPPQRDRSERAGLSKCPLKVVKHMAWRVKKLSE